MSVLQMVCIGILVAGVLVLGYFAQRQGQLWFVVKTFGQILGVILGFLLLLFIMIVAVGGEHW